MLDTMIKKNGKQVDIDPYRWVFTSDGLPPEPLDPNKPHIFYVRLDNGRTELAYYKGAVLEKWLLCGNTHIVLNENDIVAWRYQRPK